MSRKTARKPVEILEEEFSTNWLLNFKIKRPFYFNPKHKEFYESIIDNNTKISFVDGPAGTAKTYIAVYAALELLKEGAIEKIIYIRSVVESAERSLGSLPGEVDDKFSPYAAPLVEKVREITSVSTSQMLMHKGLIEAIPVNFVRGLTFNRSIVVVDEAQNLTKGELTTILTRFGRDSKYIICGDGNQSDISKSGFDDVLERFDNQECEDNNIFAFEFGNSEIARSKILRHICKMLDA